MAHEHGNTATTSSILPVTAVRDVARNVDQFTGHRLRQPRFCSARDIDVILAKDRRHLVCLVDDSAA